MAEINQDDKTKIIAFYLPQYHTIPENDKWWGKGFTEWTNVKKAKPLFTGHDQPRVPLNNNYYNLLDDDVKIWQANLAKKYGVFGFCYYHYWFKDGKQLLEKPAEQMLNNQNVDLPFCFCWANENWSRNWDGGNQEIIMEQNYGNQKDWELHFQYLLKFFKDDRYITIDGKPLFVIYKPDLIIDIYEMIQYFRKRIVEEGFPGICFAFQFPTYYADMFYKDDLFDYMIEFEPVYSRNNFKRCSSKKVNIIRNIFGEKLITFYRHLSKQKNSSYSKSKSLGMFFYDEIWNKILNQNWEDNFIPGTFVDWDNTPRNKHGIVHAGFTIEKFEKNMSLLIKKAHENNKNMIFINAWNEWGEGAYLEPDEKYGYKKLEAIKKALEENESYK